MTKDHKITPAGAGPCHRIPFPQLRKVRPGPTCRAIHSPSAHRLPLRGTPAGRDAPPGPAVGGTLSSATSRPAPLSFVSLPAGCIPTAAHLYTQSMKALLCQEALTRFSVTIAARKRPVTFRTRKLSLPAPMVLRGGPRGRVGRRRIQLERAVPQNRGTALSSCRVLAVGTQEAFAVKVDQMGGVIRTPDIRLPGDFLEILAQLHTRRQRRDEDEAGR